MEEISKTEGTTDNFIRRLEKALGDNNVPFKFDQAKEWAMFKWNEQEFSLRSNLKQTEEQLRSYISRNEDEFRAQLEDFAKVNSQVNELNKQKDNPASKAVPELIQLEPAFDKEDYHEYCCFLQLLINKPEQMKYVKDHQEILETDQICPKSLKFCKLKIKPLNTDFRIARILVMNENKKKIIDKLKIKGINVKSFGDKALHDSNPEVIKGLEAELSEKRKALNAFLTDVFKDT